MHSLLFRPSCGSYVCLFSVVLDSSRGVPFLSFTCGLVVLRGRLSRPSNVPSSIGGKSPGTLV